MRRLIHIFVLLLAIFGPGMVLILAPVSGQHPLKTDTDGDGIPDGWEVEHGLNPDDASDAGMDYNDNGLTNLEEYRRDYDPWDRDTDDDGISNYAECFGLFGFFTDPLAEDTDEDGLSDLEEICAYINTNDETQMKEIYPDEEDREGAMAEITNLGGTYRYKLDPTNPDVDGDGLSDGDEISADTNPRLVDSDRDGLSDGDEVHKYGTDPTKRDTDGDGLTDYEEVFGTYGVVTEPTNADSDGDGLSDGEEILGFGFVPIEPSERAVTYEEFISGAYSNESVTLRAKVDKIRYNPDLSNYLVFLKPESENENDTGTEWKRGVAIVNSSWHYDFEHGEMMHVDSRFNLNLREGDTIVVVGRAGEFRGSTREIKVDSGGKIYLILSPEEARERWLPSKEYVRIISGGTATPSTSSTQNTTSPPAPANSSLTPTPNSTSTPAPTSSPSAVNETNETKETNTTAADEPGAGGKSGIFGLPGEVAIGIAIIGVGVSVYFLKVRRRRESGGGKRKPSAGLSGSGVQKVTRKEWS